ncbi:MAG: hypothetical protein JNJ58_13195 [Chitinophagaceae bacterium]|nr:hypothetical protein [Chitinophagaceae bacterium]
MIYVHSFSPVEQRLFTKLTNSKNCSQLDIKDIHSEACFERLKGIHQADVIVYSFFQTSHYQYIESYQQEIQSLKYLLEYAREQKIKQFILLSTPGAYSNSDNLFLQHKGMIERMVIQSEIPNTILKIQAVTCAEKGLHSLHPLFYKNDVEAYLIPQKSNQIIYTVELNVLAEIILKVNPSHFSCSYDVFDQVMELRDSLIRYGNCSQVKRISPIYLQFMSFMGNYPAPSLIDLFIRPAIPMYCYRTEREFGINLNSGESELSSDAEIAVKKMPAFNGHHFPMDFNFQY